MKTALCRICWQPFVQAHPRDHTCDECNDLIDARQWDALDGICPRTDEASRDLSPEAAAVVAESTMTRAKEKREGEA